MNPLLNTCLYIFQKVWEEYPCPRYPTSWDAGQSRGLMETWRWHGPKLRGAWELFVESVPSEQESQSCPSRLRRWLKGDEDCAAKDFATQRLGVMIAASGVVTGRPRQPTQQKKLRPRWFLWTMLPKTFILPRIRQQRIAGMKAAGWLESLGDGRRLK
jgi:hypothetical protein